MKQITIISPDRRAGRTTLTLALAHMLAQEGPVVLIDGNLHVAQLPALLSARTRETQPVLEDHTAVIDAIRCNGCGKCQTVCRRSAIYADDAVYAVEQAACSGCLACIQVCPIEAITLQEGVTGQIIQADGRLGTVFYGTLAPGREGIRLAVELKQQASYWSVSREAAYLLVDGPVGEPDTLQAVGTGADLALILLDTPQCEVASLPPALAAAHALSRQVAVVLNRYDSALPQASALVARCQAANVSVIGHLPTVDDQALTPALLTGGAISQELGRLWRAAQLLLN